MQQLTEGTSPCDRSNICDPAGVDTALGDSAPEVVDGVLEERGVSYLDDVTNSPTLGTGFIFFRLFFGRPACLTCRGSFLVVSRVSSLQTGFSIDMEGVKAIER